MCAGVWQRWSRSFYRSTLVLRVVLPRVVELFFCVSVCMECMVSVCVCLVFSTYEFYAKFLSISCSVCLCCNFSFVSVNFVGFFPFGVCMCVCVRVCHKKAVAAVLKWGCTCDCALCTRSIEIQITF